MLYLSGCLPSKQHLRNDLLNNNIGILLTPFSQRVAPNEFIWAADNGCFSTRWDEKTWCKWLESKQSPSSALFAVVPDVVGDHCGTLERWGQYSGFVKSMGYKPAFVLQDGACVDDIPWSEFDCLFLGGTTDFKLGQTSKEITAHAKSLGKWVHMGRVNSARRISIAFEWGCDSVDGTYLAFGPDVNTPKLIAMVNRATQQLPLFMQSFDPPTNIGL